jgi:hypothetical protein
LSRLQKRHFGASHFFFTAQPRVSFAFFSRFRSVPSIEARRLLILEQGDLVGQRWPKGRRDFGLLLATGSARLFGIEHAIKIPERSDVIPS